MKVIDTFTEEETFLVGKELAKSLKNGDIVTITGDLGVGKTVFVRGIAEGLGVNDYITSPTFNIVNQYQGEKLLNHFDVYRVNDEESLFDIGFYEYINGDGISVIEWADLISDILPDKLIEIVINKDKNRIEKRVISLIGIQE